ncbi:MAG: ABC transporter permease [Candidatus Verstraetearchaeota archaeon]|nr:ABC transporter permease [Candidatus Verstraetearchaeota archaeon]
MREFHGLYALWYREIKVFLREKSRILSSIVNPLLWMIAFGFGLGPSVSLNEIDYHKFIFPGILTMTVLFSSIFFGLYIVWDKKLDFFKEVIVAPLSRITLFLGKMLGGCTQVLLQVTFLIIFGIFIGLEYNWHSLLITIIILFFLAMAATSLGLSIGSQMNSFEGFGLIQSFIVMPLFFFSGALYPLENLPNWFFDIVRINPLSYVVDGIRGALFGLNHFLIIIDILITLIFTLITIIIGIVSFMRMRL